jgi:hypothetical protein
MKVLENVSSFSRNNKLKKLVDVLMMTNAKNIHGGMYIRGQLGVPVDGEDQGRLWKAHSSKLKFAAVKFYIKNEIS